MPRWAALLACLWLAACAHTPAPPPLEGLFQDQRFGAPQERIAAADVLAVSDEMKHFLHHELAAQLRNKGLQRGLVHALYNAGQLKLEYDAATTRNAAQAFAARSGNCLSLVLMTAAFAKELNLQVEFQSAWLEETWSRGGNLYLRSGHVNVTLGRRFMDAGRSIEAGRFKDWTELTVDFLPPQDVRGLRTQVVPEQTVIAMYMNNRAAEALVDGRVGDAYWWAREAIRQAPTYLSAYNTLGVIYLRAGDARQAERVLAHVIERQPANTRAMFNLMLALNRQDRFAESARWQRRLAELEPEPPFHYFQLGQAAMQRGDFEAARAWFAKEVARADYHHEFQFWLGLAHYRLGDLQQAHKHLRLARDNSTTRGERELYAAKLAWLQAGPRLRH
jgi:tetratricopeptide (TPR) repeat protein